MAKRFVKLKQTWECTAIMDIGENETYDDVMNRVQQHLDRNGTEAVLNQGGQIHLEELRNWGTPDSQDMESYECID